MTDIDEEIELLRQRLSQALTREELDDLRPTVEKCKSKNPIILSMFQIRSEFIEVAERMRSEIIKLKERREAAEERAEKAEERREKAEEGREKAENWNKGTYLEDAAGLFDFGLEQLQVKGKRISRFFVRLARSKLPSCYEGHVFIPENVRERDLPRTAEGDVIPQTLPRSFTGSVGTNSSIKLGKKDIFGMPYNKGRAHNAPDGPTCARSWGHVAELATTEVKGSNEIKNEKRRLIIMGKAEDDGRSSLRHSPHNFVRFAAHKELYDTAPQVFLVPIMRVHDIKIWDNTPYDVMVVASKFDDKDASEAYSTILTGDYSNIETCDNKEIGIATDSLRMFMKGLAASLVIGIPIELAVEEKKIELTDVCEDIKARGIDLPNFDGTKAIRPVMKLRFEKTEGNHAIPDPFLLISKAAVNVAWSRGQKLLPACKRKADDEEEDHNLWRNIERFNLISRRESIPGTLCVPTTPTTPINATTTGKVAVVTPPRPLDEDEEDWENLG